MSDHSITFYTPDGEITSVLKGPEDFIKLNKLMTTDLYIDGEHDRDTHYITNDEVLLREVCPAEISGENKIINAPIPGVVTINNTEYPYNESTIELSFDQPGTYTIKVSSWPYLDKEFVVEN